MEILDLLDIYYNICAVPIIVVILTSDNLYFSYSYMLERDQYYMQWTW